VRLPDQVKQELQWRFEDFKKMRFPKVPPEEEAGNLRAELVLYDVYVAGYLTQLLAETEVDPTTVSQWRPEGPARRTRQAKAEPSSVR
jgi:hypothetical protein